MTDSLINQTAEKIGIKSNEKNIAYKRIYQLLCDHILCFSDGDRPYRIDSKLKPEYGTFNKLDMVKMEGNTPVWSGWDIEISAEPAMNKNRTMLIEQIKELANGGYMEPSERNLLVWKLMSKLNFPYSDTILQALQEQYDQQMAVQQQQVQAQEVKQNNPQAQMLNSIVQKIGGGNAIK
jgi:hypothetical protein